MNVSFLQELLNSVAEQGRQLIPWALGADEDDIAALSRALMSGRGEASGVAIARQIIELYRGLSAEQRRAYFQFLARDVTPDPAGVASAAQAFIETRDATRLAELQEAVESPRQEFFRRLNLAPGATQQIVAMRRDILRMMKESPELAAVDDDLRHLLGSWFNRGFLVLKRIDWNTPAVILEKIIAYEAVHEIKGWDDLRRRLDPTDRRCFAFFHPSLVDEPLIFVEVALSRAVPDSIAAVLDEAPKNGSVPAPTTAVFYSISNCQDGLKGISFGNFLIKQVAEDLLRERPSLTTFITLSPVPGFARWLEPRPQRGRYGVRDAGGSPCARHAGLAGVGTIECRRATVEGPADGARRGLFPAREGSGRPPARSRRPLPSGQRRPPRSHRLVGRPLAEGVARGAWPDGQLRVRPRRHRDQS